MPRASIIDTPDIGARAKQIRDAEMRVLAGCNCLPDPATDVTNHGEVCPLWPGLPPATPPVAGCTCPDDSIAHHATCPVLIAKKPPLGPRPEFAILTDHRRAVADAIAEGSAGR